MRLSFSKFVGARMRGLLGDQRGAIAPMFAVTLIPMLVVAGVGVDIARGMSSKNNLQDALDATALAIAHMPPNTPVATLKTKAQAWLTANLTDANLGTIDLTVTPGTGQLALSATSSVKATLTGLAGVTSIPVKASSTVKWGLSHVEIALVLDNTGSMKGTKLTTLISAAQSLVDTLQASSQNSEPDALKLAVVPFSMTVNIGSGYQNAAWMTGTAPSQYGTDIFNPVISRWSAFTSLGKYWAGCVESRPQPYDVQETAPSSGTPGSLFIPYFAPDEPGVGTSSSNTGYPNDYIPDINYVDDSSRFSERQLDS